MATSATVPDRPRLLIEAARELFSVRSYESVTTTEIARQAGVAYGLIAHHFGNKRGLYLAVMNQIRDELAHEHESPLLGSSLEELLHNALRRHVEYIETHERGFRALMRGDLGSDPEIRKMFDELRWSGARKILNRIGVEGEPSPVVRAAMRSWVALFDELMLDRLENRSISVDDIVYLAAGALLVTVRTAVEIDPTTNLDPEIEKFLRS